MAVSPEHNVTQKSFAAQTSDVYRNWWHNVAMNVSRDILIEMDVRKLRGNNAIMRIGHTFKWWS